MPTWRPVVPFGGIFTAISSLVSPLLSAQSVRAAFFFLSHLCPFPEILSRVFIFRYVLCSVAAGIPVVPLCSARGVGGLPLRWSLSTSGRVILYRARLYCINAEPRPMQDKCGRSPCGARMSILADSIRLSQGCLPAVLFRFSVYAPHIYVRHIFFL